MPARLRLADHLRKEEIFERYKGARRPVARAHWQVLWMLSQNFRTEEISSAVGYSPTWIRKLVGRYHEEGPQAMGDQRRHNRGAQPLLRPEDEAALKEVLKGDPPEGDAWTGPLVARWMSTRLGREVSRFRGREALRRLGFTPQRPRPSHDDGDAEAQAAFPGGTARSARPGTAGASRG